MNSQMRILVTGCVLTISAACASSGAGSSNEPSISPPTIAANGPLAFSDFKVPSRAGFDIRIEFWVDPAGRADLRTLQLSGRGATENEEAIRKWVAGTIFHPATEAGNPVRGLFKTGFRSKR